MDELEVRRRGILTTGKWYNPVNNMSHMKKRLSAWRILGTRDLRRVAAFGPASRGLSALDSRSSN